MYMELKEQYFYIKDSFLLSDTSLKQATDTLQKHDSKSSRKESSGQHNNYTSVRVKQLQFETLRYQI